MKLTPENLDYADCVDLSKPSGVMIPARIQKLIDAAEKAKAAKPVDTASPEKPD